MHTPRTLESMALSEADAQSETAWSRSAGLLSQSGNADNELKTQVSDEAADEFPMLARSFGMGTAEFLRIIVLARLYGVKGVSMMTAKHIEQVAGVGPKKDQSC